MKTLRFSLVLLFAASWLPATHAQTAAPFEGLRFKKFNATFENSYFTPNGLTNGTFFYLAYHLTCENKIEDGTNAYRHLKLNGYWDPSNGNHTGLSPAVEATNRFAIGTDSVVGALTDDGLKTYLDGEDLTSYGAVNSQPSEFQLPFQPFLGSGAMNIQNVGSFTNVSAELELVIAGNPNFTNDVVVKFTVSAKDADTGLDIPDADITLGTVVTNGIVWAKFADNTTNDATPTITGHSNWTACVSATIYRANIWVDEIAWFDTDTNSSGGSTGPVFTAAAAAAPGSPAIVFLQTLFTEKKTNAITGTTANTVVGKRVILYADPEGATKYEWTIGGPAVADFVGDGTAGGPDSDFATNGRYANFAWWKPGTNTVKLKVTVGGMDMERECKFTVEDPPVAVTTAAGNIALDSSHGDALGDSLHFGDAGDNPGVEFSHDGHLLLGNFKWVQIVNSSVSKLKKAGNQWTLTGSGLDTVYPYGTEIRATDSPLLEGYYDEAGGGREPLSGAYEEVEVNDSFTMYLMYEPLGGGVWVPLKQVDWDWNAKAVNVAGGWSFPVAPTKNVPAAIRATGWPTWNKNVKDAIWLAE